MGFLAKVGRKQISSMVAHAVSINRMADLTLFLVNVMLTFRGSMFVNYVCCLAAVVACLQLRILVIAIFGGQLVSYVCVIRCMSRLYVSINVVTGFNFQGQTGTAFVRNMQHSPVICQSFNSSSRSVRGSQRHIDMSMLGALGW